MLPPFELNIPNVLTIFRFLLVPVFIWLVLVDNLFYAFIVFIVAGVTDGIDGFIARRFDMATDFGAAADPIADKALVVSAFVVLALKGWVWPVLAFVVILRDILILAGCARLKLAGRPFKVRPSIYGKVTTALQITTVVAVFPVLKVPLMGVDALVYLTTAFTIVSGFHYAWVGMGIHRGGSS